MTQQLHAIGAAFARLVIGRPRIGREGLINQLAEVCRGIGECRARIGMPFDRQSRRRLSEAGGGLSLGYRLDGGQIGLDVENRGAIHQVTAAQRQPAAQGCQQRLDAC